MTKMLPSVDSSDLQDQPIFSYQSALGPTQTRLATFSEFRTESGFVFKEINVAYQTYGTLTPNSDNAILICPALSGDAHVAGINPVTGRPGWWDYHVGPGKAFDTDKFFLICSSILGGCGGTTGPSSLSPETGQPYGHQFPTITIRDIVAAQVRLINWLGIKQLFAVAGGSMGGMQALVWATDFSERVKTCLPVATCISHRAMQIAFNEIGRNAIQSDPDWKGGGYLLHSKPERGLALARMIGHVTYLSEHAMAHKFGRDRSPARALPSDQPASFAVESYLRHQGESFVRRFDPNSYLYLTRAIDSFDLFEGRSIPEALRHVRTRFLVISFTSDWLYPPSQSRELVRHLKRASVAVSYLNLNTPYGHDSFLIQNPEFGCAVGHFLNHEYGRLRN